MLNKSTNPDKHPYKVFLFLNRNSKAGFGENTVSAKTMKTKMNI